MDVSIYIDGGARGNPGPAAAGVVIHDDNHARTLLEAGFFLGSMTNNAAEYHSLIRAVQHAVKLGVKTANVLSDSQLLVRQITGEYRVKSADLRPLYEQAQRLMLRFDSWQIRHIRRKDNKRADQLVNMALDQKRDVIVGGKASDSTDTAAKQQPVETDPRWTVELVGKAGQSCPLNCPTGKRFAFGPGTPAGLCVVAAEAVFNSGPSQWSQADTQHADTTCPRCGLTIRIDVADDQ